MHRKVLLFLVAKHLKLWTVLAKMRIFLLIIHIFYQKGREVRGGRKCPQHRVMFHIEGMCFFSNQLPAIGYRFGWQPMARQPDFLQHFSSHQTHFHAEVRFSVWRNFPVDSSPKLRLEMRRDQRQPNQKMAAGLPSTGRHSSRKSQVRDVGEIEKKGKTLSIILAARNARE